jgi:hypothetical protein
MEAWTTRPHPTPDDAEPAEDADAIAAPAAVFAVDAGPSTLDASPLHARTIRPARLRANC